MTEWALPGRKCRGCGTVTFAGAAAGRVRRLGVLRAGAERCRGGADRLRERAARAGRARHGHAAGGAGLAGLGGQGQRPGWRRSWARRGFDAAMLAALAGQDALAADETPVNVLDSSAPQPAARQDEAERDPDEKDGGRRRAPRTC